MALQHEQSEGGRSSPGTKSAAPLNVFISHTSADNTFVDGLATDLEQQGFHTLVYRPNVILDSGWREEAARLIDQAQALLVILSPEAVSDEHVRDEYRYAAQQQKPVIPALHRPIRQVDATLNQVPWVTMVGSSYEQGLKQAMQALTLTAMLPAGGLNPWRYPMPMAGFTSVAPHQTPFPPSPSLKELYELGVDAKAQDNLDYAVFLWQQVVDIDPAFRPGLPSQVAELHARLLPIRIRRLRQQAERKYAKGKWDQELAAWEALTKLVPNDSQAKSRIAINNGNQKNDLYYEDARKFLRDANIRAAKDRLEYLWKVAPLYPDPNQLATRVGLPAHPGLTPLHLTLRRGGASGMAWGLCLGMIAGVWVAHFVNSHLAPTTNWIATLSGMIGCVLIGGGLALLGRAFDKRFGKITLGYALLQCLLVGGLVGLLVDAIDASFVLRIIDTTMLDALIGGLGAGCLPGVCIGWIGYVTILRRKPSGPNQDQEISARAFFIWGYCTGIFAVAGAGIIMIPYYFVNAQPQAALLPGLVGGALVSMGICLAIVPLFRSYPTKVLMFAVFGLSGVAIGAVGGSVLGYAIVLKNASVYVPFFSATAGLLIGGVILALLGGIASGAITLLLVRVRYVRAIALYK